MCGIAGSVSRSGNEPDGPGASSSAALDGLRHRGPDSRGQYRDGRVWFGHVRLSILDLTAAGDQPMASGSGRFVICYNGEVYNFGELAGALALTGLRSHSDTEVILAAFEKIGAAAIPRLNGMFAFALYDKQDQKLRLVRDRLGIKPLYYRLDARGLAFASEIKALSALDPAAPECDVSALHEWLFYGNSLGGRTLYQGIRQLPPGHCLELDLGSLHFDTEIVDSLLKDHESIFSLPPR